MDQNNSNVKRITRRKGACGNCRTRKVRCDGASTCGQCLKSGLRCSYDSPPRPSVSGKPTPPPSVSGAPHSTPTTPAISHPNSPGFALGRRNTTASHQLWRARGGDLDRAEGPDDYFGREWFGTNQASRQHSLDLSASDTSFPSHLSDAYRDDESRMSSYDMGLDGLTSFDTVSRVESDHPLDQSVDHGASGEWSRVWADSLCSDFSTLAPLRFLSRHSASALQSQAVHLSKRVWTKARHIPKGSEFVKPPDGDDNLPPYAHQDTTQFIDAFFSGCYGYPTFVPRSCIETILVDIVISPASVDAASCALLNAVLAIGCRVVTHKDNSYDNNIQTSPIPYPSSYFARALRCRESLMNGQPTVLKLQALAAMAIYMRPNRNISLTRSLLSQGIHMVHELSLSNPAPSTAGSQQSTEIERIFWLLYTIEKPFTLRFGGHSMIDDDLIAYSSPPQRRASSTTSFTEYTGWDLVHYRYARLCSVIVKKLYSQSSLKMSVMGVAASIARLSGMLEAWRLSIPAAYRPQFCSGSGIPEKSKKAWDTCIQNDILLKYAEAVFAIHRWAIIVPEAKVGPELMNSYTSSKEQCVELAKGVLRMTHGLRVHRLEVDWHHVHLPLLSATILYIAMSKSEAGKECLPHLGMGCGYFSRLSTDFFAGTVADLFEEMGEIFVLARRAITCSGNLTGQAMNQNIQSIQFQAANQPLQRSQASNQTQNSSSDSSPVSIEAMHENLDLELSISHSTTSNSMGMDLMQIDSIDMGKDNTAMELNLEGDMTTLENEWFEFPIDGQGQDGVWNVEQIEQMDPSWFEEQLKSLSAGASFTGGVTSGAG